MTEHSKSEWTLILLWTAVGFMIGVIFMSSFIRHSILSGTNRLFITRQACEVECERAE